MFLVAFRNKLKAVNLNETNASEDKIQSGDLVEAPRHSKQEHSGSKPDASKQEFQFFRKMYYFCNLCNTCFHTFKDFRRHQPDCLQSNEADIEPEDDDMEPRHGTLKRKLQTSYSEMKYRCAICSSPFRCMQDVERHVSECSLKAAEAEDVNETEHCASKHKHPLNHTTVACLKCHAVFQSVQTLFDHELLCKLKEEDEDKDKSLPSEESESSEDDDMAPCDEDTSEEEVEDYDITPLWLGSGIYGDQSRYRAKAGVEFLNKMDGGRKYELVENGPFEEGKLSGGPIHHVNFKAKAQDCPDAQVEMFFAQMRMHPEFVVDCCVSLGPSHELPRYRSANLRGCYCCRDRFIHHPEKKCAKLITEID